MQSITAHRNMNLHSANQVALKLLCQIPMHLAMNLKDSSAMILGQVPVEDLAQAKADS